MMILFFTWRPNLRRYVDVVACLAQAGHEVVVAIPERKTTSLPKAVRDTPGTRALVYEEMSDLDFAHAMGLLRNTRNYLWYLSPQQASASFNRRQALDRLIRAATNSFHREPVVRADPSWPDPVVRLPEDSRAALDEALAALDERIPPDPGIVELLRRERPDLVMVSPLLKQLMHQGEVVKAARSLGIPTAFLVYSWDNLSNKGRVHAAPDHSFVWNELQRREAVELHGLDPDSISVVGAPHWDAFFRRSPSVTREQLCAEYGFEPERPIILYLGSTTRICPDEQAVANDWLDAVRGSDRLRHVNVLVRPHPEDARLWEHWRPAHDRVAVSHHPRQQDQSLYDELFHAAVAVGLNTSAQIEASIVGRPVYTFDAGERAPGQEGTLHFHYLLREHGGPVLFASTLVEHVAQLAAGVEGDYDAEAIRRFCENFVRPRGLDLPVAPILAAEVVALAERAAINT
jgi:hypothetical protein